MRTALFTLLLTGCMYPQAAKIDQPGHTNIFLAELPDGGPAVVIYGITPESGEHINFDSSRRSLALVPGGYRFSIDCRKPGGPVIGDGVDSATFDVRSGGPFVLDCSPKNGKSNFYLEDRSTR